MAGVSHKTYKELVAASQAELEEYQKTLLKGVMSPISTVSSGRMSGKTTRYAALAAGIRARSSWSSKIYMAHLIWRYGTVIKPTAMNPTFHEETRQMIIGLRDKNSIVALDLSPDTEFDSGRLYAHLLDGLTERWEVVEEAP